MGLFSKLINYMTGGSAEVKVEIQNANLSSPFPVSVSAKIHDHDLQCEKIYILIRCTEKKKEVFKPVDGENLTDNEKIVQEMDNWESEVLYENEIQVAPKCLLKNGVKYNWPLHIDLTNQSMPTVHGKNHKVIWEVQGAIDVAGNDPDSGWVEFDVKV